MKMIATITGWKERAAAMIAAAARSIGVADARRRVSMWFSSRQM